MTVLKFFASFMEDQIFLGRRITGPPGIFAHGSYENIQT